MNYSTNSSRENIAHDHAFGDIIACNFQDERYTHPFHDCQYDDTRALMMAINEKAHLSVLVGEMGVNSLEPSFG
jgi:hypothetical protein